MHASLKKREHLAALNLEDPRWQAIAERDSGTDGKFYYSVATTGVYCRPSCGARLPRPENVSFHASREAAELAGFRPCKRCKPDQASPLIRYADKITQACRMIESAPCALALAELALHAGMSRYHFHRLFKEFTGLTPKRYIAAVRENRLRDQLSCNNSAAGEITSITKAIFDAGYNASSRFYENAHALLGMSPKRYRSGGIKTHIRFALGQCSLGLILVAQSELGICAILLGDDPEQLIRDLQSRFPHAGLAGGDADFEKVVAQVIGFVEAPGAGIHLPLDVRGTAFQQRVWQALRAIPAGKTATYTEIAQHIGMPNAARAVGLACGANALAVAIPCHRVIRNDGGLSGYRWGIERKRTLLETEALAAAGKKDSSDADK